MFRVIPFVREWNPSPIRVGILSAEQGSLTRPESVSPNRVKASATRPESFFAEPWLRSSATRPESFFRRAVVKVFRNPAGIFLSPNRG